MKSKDSANQLTWVFAAPVIVPQGDGSVVVRPGKPMSMLTAEQLAGHFSVDRDTIYRWRNEGLIPDDMVQFGGKRKLLFDAQVVATLRTHFRRLRGED